MNELWIGIAIGVGSTVAATVLFLIAGFLKTLFSLPKIVKGIQGGVECLLNGQIKHIQVTARVIEVQQASLEFIRDNRNNGNITSALEQNAKAQEACGGILDSTQQFLVDEFAGGR